MVGYEICDRTHTYWTSSSLVRVRLGSVYRWVAGIGPSMSRLTSFQQWPTRIGKVRLLTGCVNPKPIGSGDESMRRLWMVNAPDSNSNRYLCQPPRPIGSGDALLLLFADTESLSGKKYFGCQLSCVLTAILQIRTLGVCWTD
jgi:hypothetical protein